MQIGHGIVNMVFTTVVAAGCVPRGDPDAGADAGGALRFGAGLQWALWLPPLRRQCCLWHSALQYHTAKHRAHFLLTVSLPITPQSRLAQQRSPSAAAFFPRHQVVTESGKMLL